jgi:putative ABC transport system ATP-binding protein
VFGAGPAAVHALRGVDLAVADAEFVAIMGPSGSGKSTLLHILGALDRPSGGSVEIHGRRYDNLDDRALTGCAARSSASSSSSSTSCRR